MFLRSIYWYTMARSDWLTPRMWTQIPNSLYNTILMVIGSCPRYIISTMGTCCGLCHSPPLLQLLHLFAMKYDRIRQSRNGFNVYGTICSSIKEIQNYLKVISRSLEIWLISITLMALENIQYMLNINGSSQHFICVLMYAWLCIHMSVCLYGRWKDVSVLHHIQFYFFSGIVPIIKTETH